MTKTETVIQKEGSAHREETERVERQTSKEAKKIPLKAKTYEALEEKAKAEGTAPDELAAKIVEKKATSVFPAAAKINDYGFLHFKNAWLENLGWTKGMALKIEKNADGSVTLTKA
jgi:hypothetical protein